MTLDASKAETQDEPTCRFCGGKFDLGYHFLCHTCGATYCYIHMGRHARAHSTNNTQGRPSVPPDAGDLAVPPAVVALTL